MSTKANSRTWLALALATLAACAGTRPFVADNLYDEVPPREPLEADAAEIFSRPPWQLRATPAGAVRYQAEAGVALPDVAEGFDLVEVSVYGDGGDVQLDYLSRLPDQGPRSRVRIRVSVYRASGDLDDEWRSLARRWHERQNGTLTPPLPVPDDYPADTRRMAWTVPVGDGYGEPAFEQLVLFHAGAWSVRFRLTCAAEARALAAPRILAFLRQIKVPMR